MKNIILDAKLIKSIEVDLPEDYDNKGVGFLVEDDFAGSVGQILEDDGTVRDITREEVVDRFALSLQSKINLYGLQKVLTNTELTEFYTNKASDASLQLVYDKLSLGSVDMLEDTCLVDNGLLTQEKVDEIIGYTEAYEKIMTDPSTTTTTTNA